MDGNQTWTVDEARAAAERGELAQWVHDFLASPGSDNAALAELLSDPPRFWRGPLALPIDHLHRLAGPPGSPVLEEVDEDDWRDDVDDMAESVEDGTGLAPVIVSWSAGQLVLEDGTHRVEALRRAGVDLAWAVVAFEDEADRDAFVAPDPGREAALGLGDTVA